MNKIMDQARSSGRRAKFFTHKFTLGRKFERTYAQMGTEVNIKTTKQLIQGFFCRPMQQKLKKTFFTGHLFATGHFIRTYKAGSHSSHLLAHLLDIHAWNRFAMNAHSHIALGMRYRNPTRIAFKKRLARVFMQDTLLFSQQVLQQDTDS